MTTRALVGACTAALFALIAPSACVPASEPAEPAGAFGFTTEPTPATRGEPFVTTDGWTIRIETLALQLQVTATSRAPSREDGFGSASGYGYDEYRLLASQPAQVYSRALRVGPAEGGVSLSSGYVSGDGKVYDEDTENIGMSPELIARFRRSADAAYDYGGSSVAGPSLVLVARAERAGRVVVVDFGLAASVSTFLEGNSRFPGEQPPRATAVVQQNALVTLPLIIAAEALFVDGQRPDDPAGTPAKLVFDDFAALDEDGDGRVSGAEIMRDATPGALAYPDPATPLVPGDPRDRGRLGGGRGGLGSNPRTSFVQRFLLRASRLLRIR